MGLNNKSWYIIIFGLSIVATAMSLYYSFYGDLYINILDGILFDTSRAIIPCDMCRYMRIAQYPLVIISGLALRYEEYIATRKHIIGLSILGIFVSCYKVLLEYGILEMGDSGLCSFGSVVSCGKATSLFGTSISLASAGLMTFVIILLCALLVNNK